MPDLAVGSASLYDVVGDSGAAVVTWRVPGQEAGLVGDLRDVEGSRRTGLICVRKLHLKFNYPESQSRKANQTTSYSISPLRNCLTEDVDVDGGSGAAAAVGGLYDVSGAVISLGLGNGDGGVSWLGVDGHPVVWFENQVGLCPLHPGFGLTHHLGGEFDLAAGLGGQTG